MSNKIIKNKIIKNKRILLMMIIFIIILSSIIFAVSIDAIVSRYRFLNNAENTTIALYGTVLNSHYVLLSYDCALGHNACNEVCNEVIFDVDLSVSHTFLNQVAINMTNSKSVKFKCVIFDKFNDECMPLYDVNTQLCSYGIIQHTYPPMYTIGKKYGLYGNKKQELITTLFPNCSDLIIYILIVCITPLYIIGSILMVCDIFLGSNDIVSCFSNF